MKLRSYAKGEWYEAKNGFQKLYNPVNGEEVAQISSEGLDIKGMLVYAREVGSPNLRKMTFHERGRMLKNLAQYLMSRKDEFYPWSFKTGATKIDSWVDIEGGISTLFTYASKGRRELPDEKIWVRHNGAAFEKRDIYRPACLCAPAGSSGSYQCV